MICEHCGTVLSEGASVCGVCGTPVRLATPGELPKPERVGLGFLGALVGALIGGASIILISRLGYVAALSGLLIALLTLKGYEKMAGTLSKTGVIICLVLMAVTPLIAYGFELIWQVHVELQGYGLTFSDSASFVLDTLQYDDEVRMACLKDLGMLYLFMVLGAFSTIRNAFRKV